VRCPVDVLAVATAEAVVQCPVDVLAVATRNVSMTLRHRGELI
jgi:hypothetical protein